MASIDDQILRIPLIEKDEIEEGGKVDHSININQIFANKFKDLDNSPIKSRTIFRVNVSLRESNPDAYTPKMVSIGPYHKKNPQVHQMEEYKLLYLRRFLGRKEGLDVESCIKELEGLKEEALKCYDDVETDEFCQMLLLDGCFVVEFIRECQEWYPKEDKIMNSAICIERDLILLENQLPFFVLDKLHDMTKQDDESPLVKLASIISLPFFGTTKSIEERTPEGNIKHLVHSLHILSCPTKRKPNNNVQCDMDMPNATQLSEAGVKFEKHNGTSICDIEFHNGLMKIPHFQVADNTETILRNLIAYEQQSSDVQPKYFSDFSIFMDYLIDSDKDVNLLRQQGIIENLLGDDKEVANLFNKIGNGILITDFFYYKEDCIKAVEHYTEPWNNYRAILLRNYFSSPCMTASTVAAIIEEGSKVDHSIIINQIFDEKFKNLELRETNPDAYTPKKVSIGPYHNKKPQLHPMEKYKLLYLRRFLGRKEGLDVASYIKELEGLKEEALKCYDDVETDEFCQMLLLDGCFVVEYIRECSGMCPEGEDKIMNSDICIERDLILLENQLPFFVLDQLHDMTKGDDESPLVILATAIFLPFFVEFPETTIETFLGITFGNIKHLLHLKHVILCNDLLRPMVTSNATELSESFIEAGGCYNIKNILHLVRRCLCHAGNDKDNDDQTWHMVMQNATELSEAGVSFAKASFKTSTFDIIKFENGLMKIPRFRVTDSTETILPNLIAYEQQSVDVEPKHFSNFAIFMDNLIESDKDVNLLRHKGIIENWLGDDKEVANLFNKIGNGVLCPVRDFYYKEECRKAVKHCKKPWNKMKANLLRNYFSCPWVGASTVAAIVLLILTLTQTILAFIDLINK